MPVGKNNAFAVGYYHQTQVTTADKREIVLYLYEGSIRFMNQAVLALARGDVAEKCCRVTKAMDIIMELTCMLDFDKGCEISERLASLYTFTLQELMQANISREPKAARKSIRHSIGIMTTLCDGWRQILRYAPTANSLAGDDEEHQPKEFVG